MTHLLSLLDSTIYYFMGDHFLRLFLARFVFSYAVLRLHRGFKVIIDSASFQLNQLRKRTAPSR